MGAMKIMQVMRNAFLEFVSGERLKSAPPKINTQQYNYNPVVGYKPRAQAQSGRNVALGD